MNIAKFSIEHKVTTLMITLIIVVVGIISFMDLGLDMFPELEFPTLSVVTIYSGASPEDIEKNLSHPIEQIVSTIKGVKKVSSISQSGASIVLVEFEWGTNLDFAAQDIRDQLGLWKNYMPADANDPIVVKWNFSQIPILFYGIYGYSDLNELEKIFGDLVVPRLERIDGIASVYVQSPYEEEIEVAVDVDAIKNRGISLYQIENLLRSENLNIPAGYLVEGNKEYVVRTRNEFSFIKDIGEVIVSGSPAGGIVKLKDIAEIKRKARESRFTARIEKKPGLVMWVVKSSGANTVKVVDAFHKELEKIKKLLPEGIQIREVMNFAEPIKRMTSRTTSNAIWGGILAILVLLLFLRNWRPTLAISISIPLSIIATFIAVYFAGYTLNMMTLMGIALGIGMLVDNSIVVIENIYRNIEEGKDKITASIIGAKEVSTAITASTITTIIVFLPLIFIKGITGELAKPIALTVTFALLSSLLVAIVIVPMIASIIFKKQSYQEKEIYQAWFMKLRSYYGNILNWVLNHRKTIVLIVLGLFICSIALLPMIGAEFMPEMDESVLMVNLSLPPGTSMNETNEKMMEFEDIIAKTKGVVSFTTVVGYSEESEQDLAGGVGLKGPHEASSFIRLVRKSERNFSSNEFAEMIRKRLPNWENVNWVVANPSSALGTGTSPVDIKIFGKDLGVLKEIGNSVLERVSMVEGIRDVDLDIKKGIPQLDVIINKDISASMGLQSMLIGADLAGYNWGRVATRYRGGGEELNVRVVAKQKPERVEDISRLSIPTLYGENVELSQLVNFDRIETPLQIKRENQSRKVSVTANISGRNLKEVMDDIKKNLSDVEKSLPQGYFIEYGGQYDEMIEMIIKLTIAFFFSALLTYMVMASLFEAFSHPLVIMTAIPLSIIGVATGLLLMGFPLSAPSFLGIIILVGIAVNNGIVMIDYVNQLRRRGLDKMEAIKKACLIRLRPILITSSTTILGMLPMVISRADGYEMRAPMATAIVFGLLASTLLTLIVVPVFYYIMDGFVSGIKAKFSK